MVTPLRLAFFGTPEFAVPTLERLVASRHEIVAVVTQPDRPRGRGQQIRPEAVKVAAVERGLAVHQPDRASDPRWLRTLAALQPDLGVVAAYGQLLSQELLALPRLGMINVHASLLPRWRGAAPVHRAVIAGDRVAGVTIMRVILALDAGPMIAKAETEIGANETSAELEGRLATLGANLAGTVVDQMAAGPVAETAQDEAHKTYASRLTRRDSIIDWARPADVVHNQIRGTLPWPAAGALLKGRRVMFLRSAVASREPVAATPGTVVNVDAESFSVAAEPGTVRILHLQEAGRAPMSVAAFLNGRRISVGEVLVPLPEGPG
jgi:methionyl-tRNA formyltransferase